MARGDTRGQLLDAAGALVQTRGYNAFSFKDLAALVGIRTASIHYHFRTKADLGVALMQRYTAELEAELGEIEATHASALARLEAFIALYRKTEARGAICLCGSLSSDRETLPGPLQAELGRYLERSEGWVSKTLALGVEREEFELARPDAGAALLLSSLQGGLIVSRGLADPRLDTIRDQFLSMLGAA